MGRLARAPASAPESSPQIANPPFDCCLETESEGEVGCNRCGQGTAGPVGGRGCDARTFEDAKPLSRPEEVLNPVARSVASLDEHRARAERGDLPGGPPRAFRRYGETHQEPRLLEVRGREVTEGQELFPERTEPRRRQEAEAARRGPNRVEHHVPSGMLTESGGDRAHLRRPEKHSDLHGGRSEVGEDRVDLGGDKARGEGLDRLNPAGVLGRPRHDDRRGVHPVRGEGQQVRLDSGAASGIGAGDRDCRDPEG